MNAGDSIVRRDCACRKDDRHCKWPCMWMAVAFWSIAVLARNLLGFSMMACCHRIAVFS